MHVFSHLPIQAISVSEYLINCPLCCLVATGECFSGGFECNSGCKCVTCHNNDSFVPERKVFTRPNPPTLLPSLPSKHASFVPLLFLLQCAVCSLLQRAECYFSQTDNRPPWSQPWSVIRTPFAPKSPISGRGVLRTRRLPCPGICGDVIVKRAVASRNTASASRRVSPRPPAPPPCRCVQHSAILPSNRDANHCKCCRARQLMNIQSDHPYVSGRGTMSARPPLQARIMCSDLNLRSWGVPEF